MIQRHSFGCQRRVNRLNSVQAGMNNVSQQIGAALGVARISTIAASATSRCLVHHATTTTVSAHAAVHGYAVGYWWAAIPAIWTTDSTRTDRKAANRCSDSKTR